ncbi:hypothetical protein SRABI112_00191 [Pseudomonas mediterranea]|nr:hypothetical protein SRABI112_00191 [Pseudomonas mediterranea]
MGDQQQGLALNVGVELLPQSVFAAVVHGAGGFVQQQDRWIEQQGPGQQHGLALAAGEQLAAFAHRAVEALGMLAGQFADAGQFRHFEHARVADVAGAEGQVVAQTAGQQRQVMGDIADLLAQVGDVQLPQVQAVEQQLAFLRFVESHQQARQGAFARAAAADDPDPFTGLEFEARVRQRRCALVVVVERHAVDVQRPLQLGAVQWPLPGIALLGQRHQGVGAAHGELGLLITGDQPGDLPQWRQHPAAKHIGRHQRTDAEVAGDDAVDPGDDGGHAGQLLQEQSAVGRQCREVARMAVQAGEGAVGAFPLVLALAFRAAGLEGFQAAEGFDQQGLALGTEGQAFLYGVAQAHLDDQREDHRDGKRHHRNDHQPAPQQADHQQHQHGKGQVDQAGEGHGGEKFPQALEVMDALGEPADGHRPGFHRHAGDALEQGGGEDHVGFLAGAVQQVRAHHPQYQLEAGADQQPHGQHPQGRRGLVRHHAVVGLHDEQRHHQPQQVDEQTRQDRVAVQPARQFQGVAEPRFDPWHQGRAQVFEFMARPGEQRLASIIGGQLLAADPLLAAVGFAGQDQCAAVLVPASQYRATTTGQHQHHRQIER